MGCLRARTSEGAALFRAVTTSLPRCPCQNTEARSRAWAPALQQAGLNQGRRGGAGLDGGRKGATGRQSTPGQEQSVIRACAGLSVQRGTLTPAPRRPGPASRCPVWTPGCRSQRVWAAASGSHRQDGAGCTQPGERPPGEGAARWGAQRWVGLGWRETCVPEGSHVPWSSRHAAHLGTWKHHLVASGQNVQGKQGPSNRAAVPRRCPTRGSSELSHRAPARRPAGGRAELAGALELLHPPPMPPLEPPGSPRQLFSGSSV